MTTLRRRLLVWTAAGMALVLAVFAGVLYAAIARALVANFDSGLATTARMIAASVKQERSQIEVEFEEQITPEFLPGPRPAYYALWRPDGTILSRSPSLAGADLPCPAPGAGPHDLALPDGRAGRAAVLEFRPLPDEDGATSPAPDAPLLALAVARETAPMDAQLAALRWLLAGAGGAMLAAAALVAWAVVRQGLRPLADVADRIAAVRADALGVRLPAAGLPAEIAPVVARLNELLARLEEAVGRERRLTADLAHELRTPLAGMRSALQVALRRPRPAADYASTLRECLEIVEAMQHVGDNLLLLAALEAGQAEVRPETLHPAALVADLWRPHEAQARARGVQVESRMPADLACRGDRALVTMALANVLANAAEYVDDGGRIEMSGERAGATVRLAVANTGCRLSADEAARVFDRFWRADAARAATGLHCGLGLSLVARAMDAQGGEAAADAADGRFTVRLVLPADDETTLNAETAEKARRTART
jgi:signal transduction histidine kinase